MSNSVQAYPVKSFDEPTMLPAGCQILTVEREGARIWAHVIQDDAAVLVPRSIVCLYTSEKAPAGTGALLASWAIKGGGHQYIFDNGEATA